MTASTWPPVQAITILHEHIRRASSLTQADFVLHPGEPEPAPEVSA